jgi:hypothetical protein
MILMKPLLLLKATKDAKSVKVNLVVKSKNITKFKKVAKSWIKIL